MAQTSTTCDLQPRLCELLKKTPIKDSGNFFSHIYNFLAICNKIHGVLSVYQAGWKSGALFLSYKQKMISENRQISKIMHFSLMKIMYLTICVELAKEHSILVWCKSIHFSRWYAQKLSCIFVPSDLDLSPFQTLNYLSFTGDYCIRSKIPINMDIYCVRTLSKRNVGPYVWYVTDRQTDRDRHILQNEAFLLVKCIWGYVYRLVIILVLVWRKSIHFWRTCARKTIFTFSFPVTLTFDRYNSNLLSWLFLSSAMILPN